MQDPGRAASLQHRGPPLLVYSDRLHRDKDRLEPEEPRLHPDVLWLVAPVQKELLGAAYFLPPRVANLVAHVSLEGPDRAGFFSTYSRVWCAHASSLLRLHCRLRKTPAAGLPGRIARGRSC